MVGRDRVGESIEGGGAGGDPNEGWEGVSQMGFWGGELKEGGGEPGVDEQEKAVDGAHQRGLKEVRREGQSTWLGMQAAFIQCNDAVPSQCCLQVPQATHSHSTPCTPRSCKKNTSTEIAS